MSVAKVRSCSAPDAMKPEKSEMLEKEEQGSVGNFMRQAIGKEPVLSLSRSGDSSVQWIQLLHALDQQGSSRVSEYSKVDNCVEGNNHSLELCNDLTSEKNGTRESVHSLNGSISAKGTKSTAELMQALKIPDAVVAFAQAAARANGEPEKYLPGWPLLSPSKVQLQKCDKCSREFCSSINYRRHIRVHRRSLYIDKDFPKNRVCVGAFWDKLSMDEAKEIVSLADMAIEEVSGSSIIRALSSWIYKPGFASLPQTYVKAGTALLEVVQVKPSRLPITSQELFNILDDASEKTFLSSGPTIQIQKFLFDGEAGKIALEMKNLVACTSFLLEQKLVKAWLADKAAEALRCQKLLVEEEEAAQKRQVELIEKKRMKKLKQKEQKLKDLQTPGSVEGHSGSDGLPSPRPLSESEMYALEVPISLNLPWTVDHDVDSDLNLQLEPEDVDHNLDNEMRLASEFRQPIASQRQIFRSARPVHNGFNSGPIIATWSSVPMKYANYKDPKTFTHQIWTRKTKPENETDCSDLVVENRNQLVLNETCEVLIGSINVTLGDNSALHQNDSCTSGNYQKKLAQSDSSLNVNNLSEVKVQRPVGWHENGDSAKANGNDVKIEKDNLSSETANPILVGCFPSYGAHENNLESYVKDSTAAHMTSDLHGPILFSSKYAEAFLSQRWKDAIAADHVELVLPPETDASDCLDTCEGVGTTTRLEPLDCYGRSILGSAENRMGGLGPVDMAFTVSKPKIRPKPEKICKLKYVPKQRNIV
ncbi:uncharacterized protein [Typha angustifolia]|uniref:uncharacterized protein isoform X2 n=1 Tax=Typha angustifolia TaxID=59011 RepID=UPI003C2AADC5